MSWCATFKDFSYGFNDAKECVKELLDLSDDEYVDTVQEYSVKHEGCTEDDALYKVEGSNELLTYEQIKEQYNNPFPVCRQCDYGPELIGIVALK